MPFSLFSIIDYYWLFDFTLLFSTFHWFIDYCHITLLIIISFDDIISLIISFDIIIIIDIYIIYSLTLLLLLLLIIFIDYCHITPLYWLRHIISHFITLRHYWLAIDYHIIIAIIVIDIDDIDYWLAILTFSLLIIYIIDYAIDYAITPDIITDYWH